MNELTTFKEIINKWISIKRSIYRPKYKKKTQRNKHPANETHGPMLSLELSLELSCAWARIW